ncbi:unnamed protein product [Amoebophrya sp. A120]|nr:unnamed protein product [Amoebophrya sp. A120]|eukprot:GSA120T00018431001.1
MKQNENEQQDDPSSTRSVISTHSKSPAQQTPDPDSNQSSSLDDVVVHRSSWHTATAGSSQDGTKRRKPFTIGPTFEKKAISGSCCDAQRKSVRGTKTPTVRDVVHQDKDTASSTVPAHREVSSPRTFRDDHQHEFRTHAFVLDLRTRRCGGEDEANKMTNRNAPVEEKMSSPTSTSEDGVCASAKKIRQEITIHPFDSWGPPTDVTITEGSTHVQLDFLDFRELLNAQWVSPVPPLEKKHAQQAAPIGSQGSSDGKTDKNNGAATTLSSTGGCDKQRLSANKQRTKNHTAQQANSSSEYRGPNGMTPSQSSQTPQVEQKEQHSSSSERTSTTFVGFCSQAYTVAKFNVIADMLGQENTPLEDVVQVWYSSIWTRSCLRNFFASCVNVLERAAESAKTLSPLQLGDSKLEAKYLKIWAHVAGAWAEADEIKKSGTSATIPTCEINPGDDSELPLTVTAVVERHDKHALKMKDPKWIPKPGVDVTSWRNFEPVCCFSLKVDRVALIEYLFTGKLIPAGPACSRSNVVTSSVEKPGQQAGGRATAPSLKAASRENQNDSIFHSGDEAEKADAEAPGNADYASAHNSPLAASAGARSAATSDFCPALPVKQRNSRENQNRVQTTSNRKMNKSKRNKRKIQLGKTETEALPPEDFSTDVGNVTMWHNCIDPDQLLPGEVCPCLPGELHALACMSLEEYLEQLDIHVSEHDGLAPGYTHNSGDVVQLFLARTMRKLAEVRELLLARKLTIELRHQRVSISAEWEADDSAGGQRALVDEIAALRPASISWGVELDNCNMNLKAFHALARRVSSCSTTPMSSSRRGPRPAATPSKTVDEDHESSSSHTKRCAKAATSSRTRHYGCSRWLWSYETVGSKLLDFALEPDYCGAPAFSQHVCALAGGDLDKSSNSGSPAPAARDPGLLDSQSTGTAAGGLTADEDNMAALSPAKNWRVRRVLAELFEERSPTRMALSRTRNPFWKGPDDEENPEFYSTDALLDNNPLRVPATEQANHLLQTFACEVWVQHFEKQGNDNNADQGQEYQELCAGAGTGGTRCRATTKGIQLLSPLANRFSPWCWSAQPLHVEWEYE